VARSLSEISSAACRLNPDQKVPDRSFLSRKTNVGAQRAVFRSRRACASQNYRKMVVRGARDGPTP